MPGLLNTSHHLAGHQARVGVGILHGASAWILGEARARAAKDDKEGVRISAQICAAKKKRKEKKSNMGLKGRLGEGVGEVPWMSNTHRQAFWDKLG